MMHFFFQWCLIFKMLVQHPNSIPFITKKTTYHNSFWVLFRALLLWWTVPITCHQTQCMLATSIIRQCQMINVARVSFWFVLGCDMPMLRIYDFLCSYFLFTGLKLVSLSTGLFILCFLSLSYFIWLYRISSYCQNGVILGVINFIHNSFEGIFVPKIYL